MAEYGESFINKFNYICQFVGKLNYSSNFLLYNIFIFIIILETQ